MDEASPDRPSSKEIFTALQMSGSLGDALKERLCADYEGTVFLLEKIRTETVYAILHSQSHTPDELIKYITEVRDFVTHLLQGSPPPHSSKLEHIQKHLHASLEKKVISRKSLRLVDAYLRSFIYQYPPQKIHRWEDPVEEEESNEHDDHSTWKYDHGGGDKEVQQRDSITLQRSLSAIQCYITHLNTLIPPGRNLHPELSQQYLSEESPRIHTMKHIIDTIRDMLDWSENYMPYQTLFSQVAGDKRFTTKREIISFIETWEKLCKRLDLNKK